MSQMEQVIVKYQVAILKWALEQKWDRESIRLALQCQEFALRQAWAYGRRDL